MDNLYAGIVENIEQKILSNELKVAQKLPSEREMAIQYDVSRNVVREAIKVLRAKGLVKVQPGKGVYVAMPKEEVFTDTLQWVLKSNEVTKEDILDVREDLETIVIKKTVKNATTDSIHQLKKVYREMDDRKHSVNQYVAKDAEFHLTLAKSTQSKVLYVLVQSFFGLAERDLFKTTTHTLSSIVVAQQHHELLIQAIEQRNELLGGSTITQHLELLRQEMLKLQGN